MERKGGSKSKEKTEKLRWTDKQMEDRSWQRRHQRKGKWDMLVDNNIVFIVKDEGSVHKDNAMSAHITLKGCLS